MKVITGRLDASGPSGTQSVDVKLERKDDYVTCPKCRESSDIIILTLETTLEIACWCSCGHIFEHEGVGDKEERDKVLSTLAFRVKNCHVLNDSAFEKMLSDIKKVRGSSPKQGERRTRVSDEDTSSLYRAELKRLARKLEECYKMRDRDFENLLISIRHFRKVLEK